MRWGLSRAASREQPLADMFRRIFWDTALAASGILYFRMLARCGRNQTILVWNGFSVFLRPDLAINCKQRDLADL